MSSARGDGEPLLTVAETAEAYRRLHPEDQARIVAFVGAGRLSTIFARLPSESRGAIAETLSSHAADVFCEPLTAIPLAADEEAQQAALLGDLVCALLRRRGG